MPISDIVAVVAQVRCLSEGNRIGSGSGFFYTHGDKLFLVTNRHVVLDEEQDYRPDEVQLLLHTDPADVRRTDLLRVPLYKRGKRAWLEHPAGGAVDVVAVPLDAGDVKARFFIRALASTNHIPDDVDVPIGADVQVIGYPLGFHDKMHNLPIVRNATLASVYPVPFEGHPFVLIDSRLHSGTSGSPVMTKPTNILTKTDGSTAMMAGSVTFFVGVHSASIDLERDPDRDEPLGLNVVWFASLIPEIIDA